MKKEKLVTSLETKQFSKNMLFQAFLNELAMTRDEYILLLCSSISWLTLLLRRDPLDIWINPFVKGMAKLCQANTDAQFVLDSYAIATYISSHITKLDHPMTNSFRQIKESATHDNIVKVETICILGNMLLNMQHMSIR